VLSFRERDTVEEAFRRVHGAPECVRHHLYIVNDAEQLRGIVDVRDLLFASGRTPLGSLMQPPAAVLSANASIDIVSQHPAWKRHVALPVRNRRGQFVGVLYRPVDPGESLETQSASRAPGMTDPLLELAGLAWAMLALLLTSITGSGARVEGDRNVE
jgi:predicted transcriptional regulator